MKTRNVISLWVLAGVVAAIWAAAPSTAWAGRGSSPRAIQSAIQSGSVDAIQAELERAEKLVCPVCVDLVAPLVDHEDERVRQVAAWWLSRRGVRWRVHENMVGRLAGSDSIKARNAADVLGEFQHPEAIAPLSGALTGGQHSGEARAHMAKALGTIGNVKAKQALESALGASEPEVRVASLAALRSLRGNTDGSAAIPLIGDADERVRLEAINTVGALRTTAAASALLTRLQQDPSPTVRKKAAWALGEMRAPASLVGEGVAKAADSDPHPLVRSLAAAALGKLAR